jgi:nucleoside-diphosphate-sugar epimerase
VRTKNNSSALGATLEFQLRISTNLKNIFAVLPFCVFRIGAICGEVQFPKRESPSRAERRFVRKRAQRVTNVVRARFQLCRNASRDRAAFAVSASASLLAEAAEDQMPNSPKFLLENEINRSVAPTQHASNSLTRATAGLEPHTRHLKPVTCNLSTPNRKSSD